MKDTLTVTTKGTVTIPAKIRRAMGINQRGDRLDWTYDPRHKTLAIKKKTVDLRALQQEMATYIKPGTKPLTDVDAYYQKHRKIT